MGLHLVRPVFKSSLTRWRDRGARVCINRATSNVHVCDQYVIFPPSTLTIPRPQGGTEDAEINLLSAEISELSTYLYYMLPSAEIPEISELSTYLCNVLPSAEIPGPSTYLCNVKLGASQNNRSFSCFRSISRNSFFL